MRKICHSLLLLLLLILGLSNSSVPCYCEPIQGRIEATSGTEAVLPASLTVLKALTPKFDTPNKPLQGGVTTKSTALQGGVNDDSHRLKVSAEQASFPDYFVGWWGGDMTIVSSFSQPGLWQGRLRAPGTVGTTVLHFTKNGNAITLSPTTIFLPPTQRRLGDVHFFKDGYSNRKARIASSGRVPDQDRMVRIVPFISLASNEMAKLDGTTSSQLVTANTVKQLAVNVVEQDVVVRQDREGPAGNTRQTYAEFVCRFTRMENGNIFARIAKVTYGSNRVVRNRQLLEGTLSRDWKPAADKICQLHNGRSWDQIVGRFKL